MCAPAFSSIGGAERALGLSLFGSAPRFFQDCPKASASPLEAVKHAAFHADSRTARRHASSGCDPNTPGAIVDFIGAIAEYAVTISDVAHHSHFLATITSGIGIDFGNSCLTGTGCQQKHRCH